MPRWRRVQPARIGEKLLSLADRLGRARVGVVGDLAADIYISGETGRVSREAPVIVVRYERQWLRPGCAANVACNVAALGAEVHLVGLVGQDEAGEGLLQVLQDKGVDTSGVVVLPGFETTSKTRFLAGARSTMRQQVLRVDKTSAGFPSEGARSLLLERLDRLSDAVDVWIASDYGSGVVDEAVRDGLRRLAERRPVLADSRYNLLEFHGLTVVKPNQEEAAAAAGCRADTLDDHAMVAQRLRRRLGVRAALVTLGNEGMMLADEDEGAWHVPPAGGDEIVDLTGAGDTAAAVFAAGLSAGGSFLESACLANAAGGVVVMRHGAATAGLEEIRQALENWSV